MSDEEVKQRRQKCTTTLRDLLVGGKAPQRPPGARQEKG